MKTLNEVLATIPETTRIKYDFTSAVYTGALVYITGIHCPEHGEFSQYSGNLRKGIGCPKCGAWKRARSCSAFAGDFFARAAEAHARYYTYPEQKFLNMHTPIRVVCPEHGEFSIRPLKHLYAKQGCPVCGALKRGIRHTDANVGALAAATSKAKHAKGFLQRAKGVHGDLYDYSLADYRGMKQAIKIVCKTHGVFEQRPEKHIYEAQGCPQCGQKSKAEAQIADYLAIFTQVDSRNRTILKPKELDTYLPDKGLAVEYSGMYWHSHFNKEDERKNKHRHYDKYEACRQQGIRLLTVYETEWQERPNAIKRLLRNAVGKSKGKLMARKCELRKVPTPEARLFYEQYHPQGGAGGGEHYGLYWKDKLVACMRFSFGQNDRGAGAESRVWTLGRYATRVTVAGAASRLFKAFVDEFQPPQVKSFSDNRYFSGSMYAQLGFLLEADVPPDYQVWSPVLGLRPKSHYQRRKIPALLVAHNTEDTFAPEQDPRTEMEMTYLMGCGRIYDCGKKRWIWKLLTPPKNSA
jgi:hypothetical protein